MKQATTHIHLISVDPDGDDVYYYIKWGDGHTKVLDGPHVSGVDVDIAHTYANQGTFTIEAKDSNGAESGLSTLQVTMPLNKVFTNPLFLRLLERFPNAFPVLRYIFRL